MVVTVKRRTPDTQGFLDDAYSTPQKITLMYLGFH